MNDFDLAALRRAAERYRRRYANRFRDAANTPDAPTEGCPDGTIVSAELLHNLLDNYDRLARFVFALTDPTPVEDGDRYVKIRAVTLRVENRGDLARLALGLRTGGTQ